MCFCYQQLFIYFVLKELTHFAVLIIVGSRQFRTFIKIKIIQTVHGYLTHILLIGLLPLVWQGIKEIYLLSVAYRHVQIKKKR